ncbi:uncharacterized protein N0V89_007325 [Didymosphaeria variabile]|uniref:CFEM domain-containing protein n=1 Tax=Didymosphaeria variabile TaxID=1932322 RepID=A0A9W8XLA9_9PLEO|nr:uncharacterized protein N0V89_007325 [Didymosphaeria variabile]KAJ4351980.1 hypothetical protein N0V89_007325 [Didymosphaeria variabile]
MKYTFTIAALAAFTAAQSIADLPSCSLSCVVTGVSGIGCSATDFECSCTKADQLTPAITPCVQSACPSTADQQKVITVLEGICAAAGIPIDVPAPGASSSAAAAPTSAAPEPSETEASSSVAPTIQTSVPATPSLTDIVISSTGYAFPSATAEESCVVVTITVTKTSSSAVAPYPTGPVGTGVPPVVPSGTGSYSLPPPYFTGAASGMKVPAVAGLLGLAAFVL